MTAPIEFFFDFRSPYSYLAFSQLREMQVDLQLRPMKQPELMEKVNNVPTSLVCAAKGKYANVDLARWGQRYGITFNPSDRRANDGEALLRAVLAAESATDAAMITMALYQAIWSEGKTLATTQNILAVIAGAGVDISPIAAKLDAPGTVAQLDANTDEAAERGVFGSPTIFVGEAMFFGNDRLDFVREELSRLEETA